MHIYYLYVKTHTVTGLKYLGMTTRIDPHSYTGSGHYWLKHLCKHGKHYTTKIIAECQTKEELQEIGLHYSKLWNVTESSDWANLKDETGDGGDPGPFGREKLSQFHKRSLKEKYGSERANQIQKKLRNRKISKETKNKMSQSKKGKYRGIDHRVFKGYYVTPWGKFGSAIIASEASPFKLNDGTIRNWCITMQDKHLSKHTKSRFTYFSDSDIGKTFGELGFGFEPILV